MLREVVAEHWQVRGRETSRSKFVVCQPADGHVFSWRRVRTVFGQRSRESRELDAHAAIVMVGRADVAEGAKRAPEFLSNLAAKRGFRCFPRFDLAAGKLPLEPKVLVNGSLRNQHRARALDECADDGDRRDVRHFRSLLATRWIAKVQLLAGLMGDAHMTSPLHPALKIAAAVLLLLIVFHFLPEITGFALLLVFGAVGILAAVAFGATLFVAVTALVGLGAVAAVIACAIGLAPLWLPVLAVVGIVALVRSARRPNVA